VPVPGSSGGYGFIQSKSGLVLDIQGASTKSGTPVIAYTKISSQPNNQLWTFNFPQLGPGNGSLVSYRIQSKSGLFLDVNQKKDKPLTLMASSTTSQMPTGCATP
jgi:hypothetical protein